MLVAGVSMIALLRRAERRPDTDWFARTSSVQTMRTWARRAAEAADLPAPFRPPYLEWAAGGGGGTALFGPGERLGMFRCRAFLLLHRADEVLVLEEDEAGEVRAESLPIREIDLVEQGRVLLNSWLVLRAAGRRVFLQYNSVVEPLFQPIVRAVRAERPAAGLPVEEGLEAFAAECLAAVPPEEIRYVNYARASLLPGETVRRLLYQPPFAAPSSAWPWPVRPRPSHLLLLTDAALLSIRAEPVPRIAYGYVCRCVPRPHLGTLRVERAAEGRTGGRRLTLVVTAGGGPTLRLEYAPTAANEAALRDFGAGG